MCIDVRQSRGQTGYPLPFPFPYKGGSRVAQNSLRLEEKNHSVIVSVRRTFLMTLRPYGQTGPPRGPLAAPPMLSFAMVVTRSDDSNFRSVVVVAVAGRGIKDSRVILEFELMLFRTLHNDGE